MFSDMIKCLFVAGIIALMFYVVVPKYEVVHKIYVFNRVMGTVHKLRFENDYWFGK